MKPTTYGYMRGLIRHGSIIDSQSCRKEIRAYYDKHFVDTHTFGKFRVDGMRKSHKLNLIDRPMGHEIFRAIKPGDVVIMHSPSVFRSLGELLGFCDRLDAIHVTLCILNAPIGVIRTDTSRTFLDTLRTMQDMEAAISLDTKQADRLAFKAVVHRPTPKEFYKKNPNGTWQFSQEAYLLGKESNTMISGGMSSKEVAETLTKKWCKRNRKRYRGEFTQKLANLHPARIIHLAAAYRTHERQK